jgi:hypothetical protein
MDRVLIFLDEIRRQGLAKNNFLGLLNVLIGRRVTDSEGNLISAGITFRNLAAYLKKVRWDKDALGELGIAADQLAPRDRERFWYTAIIQARVDSTEAFQAGDRFASLLKEKGYVIS